MVKVTKENTVISEENQRENATTGNPAKINAQTAYDLCDERLTSFGGFLALVKFLEVIKFRDVFNDYYHSPSRKPKIGCYRMILGCLSLLFIGFHRLGHFAYIRTDSMLCGIFEMSSLPAVSTFWCYLRSLCINQSRSVLNISAVLRSRVWQMSKTDHAHIHLNIDTTVTTVYGQIEGSRKGHNAKHRGKKGLRPVLCFIDETKEYLCGKQRRGETMDGIECSELIEETKRYIPGSVKKVTVRGDGEFISWESVSACKRMGYRFIIANKRCAPVFNSRDWYTHGDYEFNETVYQPIGWEEPCRFVAMRISKELQGERQFNVFDDDNYVHRIFATDLPYRPHMVIDQYDGRANVESCIKEAQCNGLLAIPSKSFLTNHVFFQIVMLSYNLWRWMQITDACSNKQHDKIPAESNSPSNQLQSECSDHRIQFMRLKMLFIAAKIVTHSNRTKLRYSIHDVRASNIINFMMYLDNKREQQQQWNDNVGVTRFKKAG
jgi:hypothetical protein